MPALLLSGRFSPDNATLLRQPR